MGLLGGLVFLYQSHLPDGGGPGLTREGEVFSVGRPRPAACTHGHPRVTPGAPHPAPPDHLSPRSQSSQPAAHPPAPSTRVSPRLVESLPRVGAQGSCAEAQAG